ARCAQQGVTATQGGADPWAPEARRQSADHGRVPGGPDRSAGGNDRDRSGRGRSQRFAHGNRTRRALRACTIAPAARARRTRCCTIGMRPALSESSGGGRPQAAARDFRECRWVRHRTRRSQAAGSRRIPRRPSERSAALAFCRSRRGRRPHRTGARGRGDTPRRASRLGGTTPRTLARRPRRFFKSLRPAGYNALAMNLAVLAARLTLYERLMRLDKPIGTLLLLWPTMWALWLASDGNPEGRIVWIFALGTLLMRSA